MEKWFFAENLLAKDINSNHDPDESEDHTMDANMQP
jgi:hypothetical protein